MYAPAKRGNATRTDSRGVALDAVVRPPGHVRDERKDIVHRRVRVPAPERLQRPVRLHARERRVVRVEGRVRRAAQVRGHAAAEDEGVDPVVYGVCYGGRGGGT